jgi:hypothetical protein
MSGSGGAQMDLREHWESVYARRPSHEVSWFEPTPNT